MAVAKVGGRSLSPMRVTPLVPTWRDWSPGRPGPAVDPRRLSRRDERLASPARPPQWSGESGNSGGDDDDAAAALQTRRSMDWSAVRRERLAAVGAGVAAKLSSGEKGKDANGSSSAATKESAREEQKGKKTKKTQQKSEKGKGPADDDSESESESESRSESESESEDSSEGGPLLKKKKKKKKAKAKEKGHGHGHGHGHGDAKHKAAKKKSGGDIESQVKHEKAHKHKKKRTIRYLDPTGGNDKIYEDREERILPLMEPLAQVLGFIGWQIATFVLGLSLGIFLSGITPGYDIADVGINSHWWNVDLDKPIFQPPDEMLAPAWISTFSLAAVGMWFIWRRGGWKWNKLATSMYLIHLFIFQIWLCLFFFLHGLLLAVLTAFLGWVTMLVCLISFHKRSWIAVGFLAPAFAWKTFVVFDVLVIWWINNSELA